MIDGHPRVFHLQQMAQINHETVHKRRTLICQNVFGNPNPSEEEQKFSDNVMGGGLPKWDHLRVSGGVVQDEQDVLVTSG